MQPPASLRQGLNHLVLRLLTRASIPLLAAVVGLGVPLGWVWIGSQLQNGTAPSWTAFSVVIAGMILTLLVIGSLFSFLIARSQARRSERPDWMRGMTEERRVDSIADVHPLELIIFFAVFIDLIVFAVWFFTSADPGARPGTG